jgi:hypothetical protein
MEEEQQERLSMALGQSGPTTLVVVDVGDTDFMSREMKEMKFSILWVSWFDVLRFLSL